MGAPENLALLRAHDEAGLIVALVVASGDHDEPIDNARFVGRVGVAARVHERINLPATPSRSRCRVAAHRRSRRWSRSIRSHRRIRAAKETPTDSSEIDDLVTRVVSAAETLAELVDRIPTRCPRSSR
jgi:ATP-dependent Lon protease